MDEERLFHLTGRRTASLRPPDGLRPALLAPFRDLSRLRIEFPLVLLDTPGNGPFVETLSGIVDRLLRSAGAAGAAGDRLRADAHRTERALRAMLAAGASGTLRALWADAAVRAGAARTVAEALPDGRVVDCDGMTPLRVVQHLWRIAADRRGAALRRRVDGLALRLSELVRADVQRSREGRRADALRAGFGPPHRDLFDFDLLAHLVATPSGPLGLPPRRRRRIENALAELRVGRSLADAAPVSGVRGAATAYRQRLPRMTALVRAIAVAELEAGGRYVDDEHDPVLEALVPSDLGPDDRLLFAPPLARVGPRREHPGPARDGTGARAEVLDALVSDLPMKVLIETDDPFGPEAQLATAAMGLEGVFVVQAASSHLRSAASEILAAIEHTGPAVISVFTGAHGSAPAYLVAAATAESRAFAGFSRDPRRDPPVRVLPVAQADRTWPAHVLRYADRDLQRVTEAVELTPADAALLDPRQAEHFAAAPWVPPGGSTDGGAARPPYVYAIDEADRLHRVLVDDHILALTHRAAETWTRLRALAAARPEPVAAPSPAAVPAPTNGASAEKTAAPGGPAPREPARDVGDPYIETARCSSCNECTLINPRMFAYNADRQAYIADPGAGTYRELVEAAESCQVAIIHPGAPRDRSEPGVEELIERAAAFR